MYLTSLLKAGESGLGYVKSLGMPLGLAEMACGIDSAFSDTGDLSQKILKSVKIAGEPVAFSALALNTLKLVRSFNAPKLNTAKISKLALSVLKKGCCMLRRLEGYRFITLGSTLLGRLKGIVILSSFAKRSIRLWQGLGSLAARDLLLAITKVLKSSLLIYAYVADDKRVKVVTQGIDFVCDSYCLYQKCHTLKSCGEPRDWTINRTQAGQIISSISLTALAFYAIEKGFFIK